MGSQRVGHNLSTEQQFKVYVVLYFIHSWIMQYLCCSIVWLGCSGTGLPRELVKISHSLAPAWNSDVFWRFSWFPETHEYAVVTFVFLGANFICLVVWIFDELPVVKMSFQKACQSQASVFSKVDLLPQREVWQVPRRIKIWAPSGRRQCGQMGLGIWSLSHAFNATSLP